MMRTIRKLTVLLLTLALTFALLPGAALAVETDSTLPTSVSEFSKGKTLRILAVGNSFSVDGLHYLYQMAKSAGYNVVIGDLYASRYSLKDHWEKGCLKGSNTAIDDAKVYTYYKISDETGGTWKYDKDKKTSMAQALQEEPWDVITLQQASGVSGVPASYVSNSWSCSKSGDVSDTTALSDQSEPDTSVSSEDGSVGSQTSNPKRAQTITCGVSKSGNSSSFSLDASAHTDLSYEVSNPSDHSVLTVNQDGVVTLTGSGTAVVKITAAKNDEYDEATAKITISNDVDDYLSLLAHYVAHYVKREYPDKQVKLGWQMTWAYAKKDVSSEFKKSYENYGSNQSTMYHKIVDTVKTTVADSKLFSFCIPTGTAIQNARSSYAGDYFNRDGVHLSLGLGRYIAGMTWAAALGISPSQITYRPAAGNFVCVKDLPVSSLDRNMIRESVTNAIQSPWWYTKSAYHNKPTLKATTLKSLRNDSGGLHLTWSKVDHATGYQIYRRTDRGSFDKIKTLTDGAVTSYTDTAVKSKSGTNYTYYVRAVSGELITASNSNQLRMTRLAAPAAVTVGNAGGGVKITWSKVAAAVTYRVYRKTDSGSRTCITTTNNRTFAYTDSKVKAQNGTSYTYDVVAWAKLVEGAPSSGKTVTRLTGVTLKQVEKSGNTLKLIWTRNSKAAGYVVYRKAGSGSWSKVKAITKNSTLTYTDGTVKTGKTYSYRVCAHKGSDNSVVSNTKSIKR